MAELILSITNSLVGRVALFAVVAILCIGIVTAYGSKSAPRTRFSHGMAIIVFGMAVQIAPLAFAVVSPTSIDLAAWTYLGVVVGASMLLSWTAVGRSIDAYGNAGKAFYSIIPIANLILLFHSPSGNYIIKRTPFEKGVRIAVFVAMALLVLLAGAMVRVVFESASKQSQANLADLPIERAVKVYSLLLEATVPSAVDDATILTGAYSEGKELFLEYYIVKEKLGTVNYQVAAAVLPPIVTKGMCSDAAIEQLIKRGSSITVSYSGFENDIKFSFSECD